MFFRQTSNRGYDKSSANASNECYQLRNWNRLVLLTEVFLKSEEMRMNP